MKLLKGHGKKYFSLKTITVVSASIALQEIEARRIYHKNAYSLDLFNKDPPCNHFFITQTYI